MSKPITPSQFATLAKIMETSEPLVEAVRMVLVDNVRVRDAVQKTEVKQPSISRAVSRYKAMHELILAGYQNEPGKTSK